MSCNEQKKRRISFLDSLTGQIIGNIHITVCKTTDGDKFFHIYADDENVSNLLDIIENILICY